MNHIKEYPPQAMLKRLFLYDVSGYLIRRTNPSHNTKVGDRVGTKSNGYLSVMINDSPYKVHRLIWIWHNGSLNETNSLIDHKDRNKLNNKIENLRLSTGSLNQFNRGSKTIGCTLDKSVNRWSAKIQINGKRKYLGYYDTKEEASAAYLKAKQQHIKEVKCLI